MLRKAQIIENILERTPSTSTEFLQRFDRSELLEYLQHLDFAFTPREQATPWVRRDGCRSIVTRRKPAA